MCNTGTIFAIFDAAQCFYVCIFFTATFFCFIYYFSPYALATYLLFNNCWLSESLHKISIFVDFVPELLVCAQMVKESLFSILCTAQERVGAEKIQSRLWKKCSNKYKAHNITAFPYSLLQCLHSTHSVHPPGCWHWCFPQRWRLGTILVQWRRSDLLSWQILSLWPPLV